MKINLEIEIAASPHRVWEVLADVERWSEWTPTVNSIRLLDREKAALRVGGQARIRQPRLPQMTWRVTHVDPDRGFVWETRNWGAVTRAEHWIHAEGPDHSTVVLKVEMHALLEPLFRPWLKKMISENVAIEAAGLKRRCEALDMQAA